MILMLHTRKLETWLSSLVALELIPEILETSLKLVNDKVSALEVHQQVDEVLPRVIRFEDIYRRDYSAWNNRLQSLERHDLSTRTLLTELERKV